MDSALFEFSKEFNMPLKETSEAYDRLVTLGVIFSPSRSAEEFFSRKHPARFAPVGPTANSSSTLSFGPFAIRRADYEKLWKDLPDKMRDVGAGDADASAAILLSFKRCQYEKLGAVASDEDAYEKRKLGFFANDDAFYPLVSVTSMWNLETPVVREKWVWFLPGERCRKLAEKITGEKFGPEDYSWWDVEIDFGDGFEARTPKDFANEFSFSPEYILGPWSRYLPLAVIDSLYVIYSHATTGLKFTKFDSISDILIA